MPLIDMPLEELYQYQGRNPRPANFDSYWDTALAEMRAIDPQVELKPLPSHSKHVEAFELTFTGVGGARVYAKYMRPKNFTGTRPIVMNFHGYTGSSGDWFGYRGWLSEGFCVAALDCRGQGGYSEDVGGVKGNTFNGHIIRGLDDVPEKLMYRGLYLDTAQLTDIVMGFPEVDAERVVATGGSQGGGLTLACAALHSGIKKAAPAFPFLCDYKRVWEMDQAAGAYAELRTHFRTYDPLHEREEEIWTKLGYIDVQHLAPRINGEVMMFTGLMDNICPPSSQFAAYNKIISPKQVVIYPDFGHEGLPRASDMIFEWLIQI
ncbi:MAG: acetylxylan esterase [Armatimonadota bacterium]